MFYELLGVYYIFCNDILLAVVGVFIRRIFEKNGSHQCEMDQKLTTSHCINLQQHFTWFALEMKEMGLSVYLGSMYHFFSYYFDSVSRWLKSVRLGLTYL